MNNNFGHIIKKNDLSSEKIEFPEVIMSLPPKCVVFFGEVWMDRSVLDFWICSPTRWGIVHLVHPMGCVDSTSCPVKMTVSGHEL